jgi:hypothetical protein
MNRVSNSELTNYLSHYQATSDVWCREVITNLYTPQFGYKNGKGSNSATDTGNAGKNGTKLDVNQVEMKADRIADREMLKGTMA